MKAFVIMPFDDEIANDIYKLSTKPICKCKEFNLDVERADEIFTTNPIIEDILSAIEEASVIIADISGKNPNVFYELGLSHILKRTQTIMITHDEYGTLPFDITHLRIIKYENSISGKSKFESQLRKTLKNILRDYKSIYKNEFDILLNFLIGTSGENDLYSLLTLYKSPFPIKTGDPLNYEAHNITGNKHSSYNARAEGSFTKFLQLNYVEIKAGILSLTDKGKAFAEILEEKGFVIDVINDHILANGYVPFGKRIKERKKTGKNKKS